LKKNVTNVFLDKTLFFFNKAENLWKIFLKENFNNNMYFFLKSKKYTDKNIKTKKLNFLFFLYFFKRYFKDKKTIKKILGYYWNTEWKNPVINLLPNDYLYDDWCINYITKQLNRKEFDKEIEKIRYLITSIQIE